ncbi:hypothetical protein TDB9533_02047 [Thalassocella blandensis]|nr:hypothetical protein TDB9533_02047 [Thalassocella blandensis]
MVNHEKLRRMELRKTSGTRNINRPIPPPSHRGPRYLVAHACFTCRKSFKVPGKDIGSNLCPECRGDLVFMGRAFKAPKQSNKREWRKIQALIERGYNFNAYRQSNPLNYPKNLADLKAFFSEIAD